MKLSESIGTNSATFNDQDIHESSFEITITTENDDIMNMQFGTIYKAMPNKMKNLNAFLNAEQQNFLSFEMSVTSGRRQ